MSKDVELGEFQCKFGELRDELDLKVNHSAKLKEIRMVCFCIFSVFQSLRMTIRNWFENSVMAG